MTTLPVAECVNKCADGEGAVLLYPPKGFGTQTSYCYQIQQDRVCRINGQYTSLLTNTQVSEQQAVATNPASCDFNDVACWLSDLSGKALNIGATIINSVVALITAALKDIALALTKTMNRVIEYFMSIPVSPSNDDAPPFVHSAWNIMRHFVDSLFILILALIGFATILRIQSYQFQKTLPALLIIVLLINFSGVLVGFVVDIGNVITNYFLTEAGGPPWQNTIREVPNWGGADALALNIVQIVYYFVSILIYLTVMLLFGLRTIVLWALAIISPIAFALYILPATRRYWNQWWQQLIQWALLGIPISIFIFLASEVVEAGSIKNYANVPEGLGGVIVSLLAPLTTLFLLFYGVTLSMQLAPAGAKGVVKFGRSVPGRLANTRIASHALAGLAEKTQQALSSKPASFAGGGLLNRAVGEKLLGYAARKRKFQPPQNFADLTTSQKESIASAKGLNDSDLVQYAAKMGKELKHTSPEFRAKIAASALKSSNTSYLLDSVGAIADIMPEIVTAQLLENMETAGTPDPARRKKIQDKIAETKEEIVKDIGKDDLTIEAGLRFKLITDEDVERDRGAAIAQAKTKLAPEQMNSFLNDTAASAIYSRELKAPDIANVINPDTLGFRYGTRDASPSTFQALLNNFDREKFDKVMNGAGGIGNLNAEELYGRNQKLFNWLTQNPVGRVVDWAGRDQMTNVDDKPTTNLRDFDTRMRLLKNLRETRLDDRTTLLDYRNLVNAVQALE
ncbi:MAG: hypothetical protein HYS60_02535, partial [Candidatus Wildermuthbacteria bacterium]|nr:hypothetical protein [Candidatus Wildermuthbacteria bacterium]